MTKANKIERAKQILLIKKVIKKLIPKVTENGIATNQNLIVNASILYIFKNPF